MQLKKRSRIIGILLIAVSLFLSISFLLKYHQILHFVENNFSSDQQITPNGERELTSSFFSGMTLLIGIGFSMVKAQDETWLGRMRCIFFDEPLCCNAQVRLSGKSILIISILAGFLLIASMQIGYRNPSLYRFLYLKDHGLVDLMVPIIMLVSVLFLCTAIWRLIKEPQLTKSRKVISVVYLSILILFVFNAGEETSWGQDFLK